MKQQTQKSGRIRGVVENPSPDAPGVGGTPLVAKAACAHICSLLSYSCQWKLGFGILSVIQEAE